jgi:hypothetical protein
MDHSDNGSCGPMQVRWSSLLRRVQAPRVQHIYIGRGDAVGFGDYAEVGLITPHGPADVALLKGHTHIVQSLRAHGRWRLVAQHAELPAVK